MGRPYSYGGSKRGNGIGDEIRGEVWTGKLRR
jgi:hypothetical protein